MYHRELCIFLKKFSRLFNKVLSVRLVSSMWDMFIRGVLTRLLRILLKIVGDYWTSGRIFLKYKVLYGTVTPS